MNKREKKMVDDIETRNVFMKFIIQLNRFHSTFYSCLNDSNSAGADKIYDNLIPKFPSQ